MADDKIRSGEPEKRKKKAAAKPPVEEDEEEERPRKKKRPADDADDEMPRRKKRKREDDNDSGGSALAAILPVGGSVFALVSLWIGVLSVILGVVALASVFDAITVAGIGKLPGFVTLLMPTLWPIALLSGGLSFFTQKFKLTYGSIAGNIRAIIGILLSLVAMVLQAVLVSLFIKGG